MPKRVKRALRTVCPDMDEGFLNCGQGGVGKAQLGIDRYHVSKLYPRGLPTVAQARGATAQAGVAQGAYAKINGRYGPSERTAADLEGEERDLLKRVFAYSPAVQQAYEYPGASDGPLRGGAVERTSSAKVKNWQQRVRASG